MNINEFLLNIKKDYPAFNIRLVNISYGKCMRWYDYILDDKTNILIVENKHPNKHLFKGSSKKYLLLANNAPYIKTAATNNYSKQHINKWLMRGGDCLICFEPLGMKKSDICIECANIICITCADQLDRCPICRTSWV